MEPTLAGWLRLHGLDAARARALLPPAPPGEPPPAAPDPARADPDPWGRVRAALARALPEAAPVLDRVARAVRVDLAPGPSRPRPFTLHDDGGGRPFVSCRVRGRASDLLDLGHELGHAVQAVAAPGPRPGAPPPPALREAAALLAEGLVADGIAADDPATGAALAALLRARRRRLAARHGPSLARALDAPATPFSYGWAYALGLGLVARAEAGDAGRRWRLLSGAADLAEAEGWPAP